MMMMMTAAADATLPDDTPNDENQPATTTVEKPIETPPKASIPNSDTVDLPAVVVSDAKGAVNTPVSLPEMPRTEVSTIKGESNSSTKQAQALPASTETLSAIVDSPQTKAKKPAPPPKKDPPPPKPLTAEEEVTLRRKQKLQSLWWNRLLGVVRWLVLGAIGYGIYYLAQQPFWMITPQQVHFTGTNILSDATLLPPIQKELNRPLYALQPQAIESELKKRFPLISAVQIRRRLFPIGLDVQVNEHEPWALIYDPWEKDAVLSYYRQVFLPLHFPKQPHPWGVVPVAKKPMLKPYAFVLETYQSMRFNGQQFTLSPTVLSPDSLMIFTSTQWFRNMPHHKRLKFLKDMDRLLNGVRAVASVQVDALAYNQQQDALTLDLRLENQPKQPVTALLGGWDAGLFDRALRLKPLIAGLSFVKEAVGNEKAGSCYKQFDFRWGQNVTVELCNPSLLEKPMLEEDAKPLVVLEEEATGNVQPTEPSTDTDELTPVAKPH
ncbi:MAG: FtsQ-type POTRA domain-containing protein [Vampirovibrio sp.]|nr:FtsQ-type POTRA domain-containing protein [Vampirovibrio sp.]